MEIINNFATQVDFTCLNPGDVFLFKDEVYMRLKDDPKTINNVVKLRTGDTFFMSYGCDVVKVNAKLTINQ